MDAGGWEKEDGGDAVQSNAVWNTRGGPRPRVRADKPHKTAVVGLSTVVQ